MFNWNLVKLKYKIALILGMGGAHKIIEKYFRKKGIKLGEGCCIYSDISSSESYLITVGNNVTISNDVQFITHDNSIDRLSSEVSDVLGEITIGDNCFIGARAIILPGVTLGNECVVAAGAVVTKSFPSGSVIGGNPAKLIGNSKGLVKKYSGLAYGRSDSKFGKKYFAENSSQKILRNR